jgi:uncharacterized membrane protein
LVLVLPGYATTAALLSSDTLHGLERALYAVALSVALTVACGIALQLVTELDRDVWAIALTALTIAACAMAQRRRSRVGGSIFDAHARRVLPSPVACGLILLAIGISAGAIALASSGAEGDADRTRFSALWALPAPEREDGSIDRIEIGLENHLGNRARYAVVVRNEDGVLFKRALRLAPGRTWRRELEVPRITPSRPVRVSLLRNGELHRRVSLVSGDPL